MKTVWPSCCHEPLCDLTRTLSIRTDHHRFDRIETVSICDADDVFAPHRSNLMLSGNSQRTASAAARLTPRVSRQRRARKAVLGGALLPARIGTAAGPQLPAALHLPALAVWHGTC